MPDPFFAARPSTSETYPSLSRSSSWRRLLSCYLSCSVILSHRWNGLTSGEIMKNGGLNPEKHTKICENHQTIEILMEKSSINEGSNGNTENDAYK